MLKFNGFITNNLVYLQALEDTPDSLSRNRNTTVLDSPNSKNSRHQNVPTVCEQSTVKTKQVGSKLDFKTKTKGAEKLNLQETESLYNLIARVCIRSHNHNIINIICGEINSLSRQHTSASAFRIELSFGRAKTAGALVLGTSESTSGCFLELLKLVPCFKLDTSWIVTHWR